MTMTAYNPEDLKKISSIGKYFLFHCGKLPKGRFVKLFYLLDWKSAIERTQTVTNFSWFYNHYGPYLPEVITMVTESSPDIVISRETSVMGVTSQYIHLKCDSKINTFDPLSTSELNLAEKVVSSTKDLNFDQFIKLVYSTYPIRCSQKYSELDLLELAKNYNHSRNRIPYRL